MTDSKQIKRDLCWYAAGLSITLAYMFSVYYMVLPRWSGVISAVLYLSVAACMFHMESDDSYLGTVAFVFAALPSIGYAMSSNPTRPDIFRLLVRLYVIGFVFVTLVWSARRYLEWNDSRERRKSSE